MFIEGGAHEPLNHSNVKTSIARLILVLTMLCVLFRGSVPPTRHRILDALKCLFSTGSVSSYIEAVIWSRFTFHDCCPHLDLLVQTFITAVLWEHWTFVNERLYRVPWKASTKRPCWTQRPPARMINSAIELRVLLITPTYVQDSVPRQGNRVVVWLITSKSWSERVGPCRRKNVVLSVQSLQAIPFRFGCRSLKIDPPRSQMAQSRSVYSLQVETPTAC